MPARFRLAARLLGLATLLSLAAPVAHAAILTGYEDYNSQVIIDRDGDNDAQTFRLPRAADVTSVELLMAYANANTPPTQPIFIKLFAITPSPPTNRSQKTPDHFKAVIACHNDSNIGIGTSANLCWPVMERSSILPRA